MLSFLATLRVVVDEMHEQNGTVIELGLTCQRKCSGLLYNNTKIEDWQSTPMSSRPNVVVRSPTPFGLGRNGCWPSRGSQLPRALPFIFSLCCPLNDRRRAAHSFFKNRTPLLSFSLLSFFVSSFFSIS